MFPLQQWSGVYFIFTCIYLVKSSEFVENEWIEDTHIHNYYYNLYNNQQTEQKTHDYKPYYNTQTETETNTIPRNVRSTNQRHQYKPRDRPNCRYRDEYAREDQDDVDQKISTLRLKLMQENLFGYIVVENDEHEDSNLHFNDRKAGYMSNYYYEEGTSKAVITLFKQSLFVWNTLDANLRVPCSWEIHPRMDINSWIGNNAPTGSRIGINPKIVTPKTWITTKTALGINNKYLVAVKDFIDVKNSTKTENLTIKAHLTKFSGKDWDMKMAELLSGMERDSSDALVITTVDDIAWLFNLRGFYYETSPLFPSFAVIVTPDSILERKMKLHLYVRQSDLLTEDVKTHLKIDSCDRFCIEVKEYALIYEDLKALNTDNSISNVLVDRNARFAITEQVEEAKIRMVITPVALMKVVKNKVQIEAMTQACVRDAAYLIKIIADTEEKVQNGDVITEVDFVKELSKIRRTDPLNWGEAFRTVAAFGAHGAQIHYRPVNATNSRISDNELFVVDSGGQYEDGTIDGTRTFHFGNPREFEREIYTRVLMASVDILSAVWVAHSGKPQYLISIARKPLWEIGLDYSHGTGHGVGQFSNVHEEPINFYWKYSGPDPALQEYRYEENTVQALEPGAYFPGKFGVRLETMVYVKNKDHNTDYHELRKKNRFPRFGFEPMYFVPFETKLMKLELLSKNQIRWINAYHAQCMEIVGSELKKRNFQAAYAWLQERTIPIELSWPTPINSTRSSANHYNFSYISCFPIIFVKMLISTR